MVDEVIRSKVRSVDEEEETVPVTKHDDREQEKGAVAQWSEQAKKEAKEEKPRFTIPYLKFIERKNNVLIYEIVDEARLPTMEDAFEAGWEFNGIDQRKVNNRFVYDARLVRPRVLIRNSIRRRRYVMPAELTEDDIKKLQTDIAEEFEYKPPIPFDLKAKTIFYHLKAKEEGKSSPLPRVQAIKPVQPQTEEDQVAQAAAELYREMSPDDPALREPILPSNVDIPEVAVETAAEFRPRSDPLIGYSKIGGNPTPVFVKPVHVLIVGLTRNSGKTTTMEGYLSRMTGKKIIVFLLKRGEDVFTSKKYHRIRPFMRVSTSWRDIQSVIEDEFKEKNRAIRPDLIAVTKLMMEDEEKSKTLRGIYNLVTYLVKNPGNKSGQPSGALLQLWAYLGDIVEKLDKIKDLSEELDLQTGINVMDLSGLDDSVQGLIVASVAHEILDNLIDVILYVPEAHKIIPKTNAPAKKPLERLIREGGVLGNNVYIDSQDITALDTPVIRSIDTVLIGKQQEDNELQKALSNLPVNQIPTNSLQRLKLGQFFLVHNGEVKLIFSVPPWMTQEQAILCCDEPSYVYMIAKQREQAALLKQQGILKQAGPQ